MNTKTVRIVDIGRGPQLSTSRVTAQDLLPYYREESSNEEIRRWIPSLTDEEITVLKDYIREHFAEVVQAENEIKVGNERMRAMQPAWTRAGDRLSIEERQVLLRERLAQRKMETNGASDSPG